MEDYNRYEEAGRTAQDKAKLIVQAAADYPQVLKRAYRALCEFRLEGVASNLHFLQNLLQHPLPLDLQELRQVLVEFRMTSF